ncbi:MAG: hypothetical protein DI539_05000 [Flavobacterium psychrophilum]|nr:MAG: hypothetical protein DI539_05000 [Flavobacterium psychrophilum]
MFAGAKIQKFIVFLIPTLFKGVGVIIYKYLLFSIAPLSFGEGLGVRPKKIPRHSEGFSI